MPTLELLIDASGMQRGAQQAETALRTVKTAAESASKAVDSVYGGGTSIGGRDTGVAFRGSLTSGLGSGNASQVLGGSIQSAAGIAQTAQALGQLNIQAAAFGAARSAFEIGNTIDDFTRFRAGIGGATTAMSALGVAFKANPFGIIAAGIGIAATAMSLFGGETKKATEEVKAQVSELNRLQSEIPGISARAALGGGDPRGSDSRLIDTILALRSQGANTLPGNSAASLFGVSEEFLRYGLSESGINPNATRPGQGRSDFSTDALGRRVGPGAIAPPAGVSAAAGGFAVQAFPADQLARFGETLLEQRRGRAASDDTTGREAAGFRAAEMQAEFNARERAEDASREAQQAAAERIAESMERAAQFGEQIGASVGDAAAQMLFAGRSFRDVVSNLVRQFATQGLQDAGAGLFRAAVSGLTATQTQANAGPPGGIGPPAP